MFRADRGQENLTILHSKLDPLEKLDVKARKNSTGCFLTPD